MAQDEPFHLWPECVPAWRVWNAVQSQWLHSFEGREGLSYPGVEVVMRMHRVRRRDWSSTFVLLQAMERAALEVWDEERRRARARTARG